MIVGIVNGYFRSGSTLLWRLIRESNPDVIHLYEPLNPDLPKALKKWKVGNKDGLHGLPIWDDYFKLPKDVLAKMLSNHRIWHVAFNYVEIHEYLKPVERIKDKVIIQPNRCHPILYALSELFNCPVIHIIRNPVDTWMDHFPPNLQRNINVLKGTAKDIDYGVRFYLYDVYKTLKANVHDLPDVSNPLEVFLVNYAVCNYLAYKNVKHIPDGVIVYFEDLITKPITVFEEIFYTTDIIIKPELQNVIRKGEAYKGDYAIADIVFRALDRLDLDKYLKGWFIWTV